MSFSRRQFIQLSGISLCAAGVPSSARTVSKGTLLPVPPLLEPRRGQPIFLTLQHSNWSFNADNRKVPVWGVNGLYLGPTVRVRNGDNVKLIYNNRLNESISMTVAGLLVPGELMGGAGREITPMSSWSPVVPVRQAAATCWYHANTQGKMASHVYNGLAGMWLIEDHISENLAIPKQYGVDDFPLILQDKKLDNFGFPQYNPEKESEFMGNRLLVNGVQSPYIDVSPSWVRLRLLNASNARRYQLALSDGRPFYVIASDAGFLPAPVPVKQLSLASGERREVLIDMSQGKEVSVTAGEQAGVMDRLRGLFEPSTILISSLVLNLRSGGPKPLFTDTLPMRLMADQLLDSLPRRTRIFRLGDRLPGINDAKWDRRRIDTQVQQGSVERWIINADRPQSFHIAGGIFLITHVNGVQPVGEDRGWKDTLWVDGCVELLVTFPQPSSQLFPFVYHSQTLEMADRGTAGQLLVQPAQ